ncbi:hypothetical protein VI35_17375 [Aeromonas caviae]|nr:hypothetical protein VI35_17375 [Aeromonas caviae]
MSRTQRVTPRENETHGRTRREECEAEDAAEAKRSVWRGGPVGLDNLAAAIGEEKDTIEDVLEPYLIQQGYLQRTPRGRIATQRAYVHFGLERPADQ